MEECKKCQQLQDTLILNVKVREDAERRLQIEFTRAEQLNRKLTEVQMSKVTLQGDYERLAATSQKLSTQTDEIHGSAAVLLKTHEELLKATKGLLNMLPRKAREVWLQQYPMLAQKEANA